MKGEACKLARTRVDQQVDAILGRDDVGFEEAAWLRVGAEVVEAERS
jgi:hypothetical protein